MINSYRVIGLTGGIATGKTTVAEYLAAKYNLPVGDADIYAREAVAVGAAGLAAVVSRYGPGILLADGSLDRPQLGNIIFHNPSERLWLESIIHPYVRRRLVEFTASCIHEGKELIILAVPLLFEAKMTDLCTEIWVVSCGSDPQLQRLMARDKLTLDQAQARIHSQMPLAEKAAQADIILDNSSTKEYLCQQIDAAIKS
ncbi:MAG TPA: dephospho-CoA kinase [Oscillatoriaceae cyanobacterium M33_DOE_052]|uniref:Dephospho-CoA kinase n=1 Tax=Planktothricoides sp. SpSt-374 TaxID=2282167 RepID=A0A7C3ZTT4_9CYAN|nr:dephospho-CoA kinase [Oscillatoriaceae cyanobacterium M33_DOE_052]